MLALPGLERLISSAVTNGLYSSSCAEFFSPKLSGHNSLFVQVGNESHLPILLLKKKKKKPALFNQSRSYTGVLDSAMRLVAFQPGKEKMRAPEVH